MMNFVKLRISGEDIDLEKVSSTLNMTPKFICKKNDINYNKITNQPITYSEDCWIAGIEIEHEEETERKILEFIDLLYKNKNTIQQLSMMHHITLWITLNQDTTQYNLHFSKEVLNKVSDLGIDIDITCMQLQEFYTETYLSDKINE